EGHLLGRLDDRVARTELEIKEQKLTIAKTEFDTAQKVADEAKVRYERMARLGNQKAVAEEEVADRRLAWERAAGAAKAGREAVASAREGIVVFVGTEVKQGERVPAEEVVKVRTPEGDRQFRRLREGDAVEAGQFLARVDDRLARAEVAIRQQRVLAARTEF